MLFEITLKNFTIVDEISVCFTPGLNIITGETGAGKSIIVDALNIILGDRATPEFIKSDRDEASIEALFIFKDNNDSKLRIESLGYELPEGELLIKRTISRGARGRVFINGSPCTLGILEKITQGIVDIFSQHEHQTLLKKENHVKVLDQIGGLSQLLSPYSEQYKEYISLKKELNSLLQDKNNQIEREDFLKFQLKEIMDAELVPGEDQTLEDEKKRLLNSEKLLTSAENAYDTLYESDSAVLGALNNISVSLTNAADADPQLKPVTEVIKKSIVQIEEAAFTLRDYTAGFEFEEGRLDRIEERLDTINTLKRKYSGTIAEILERKDGFETELNKIVNHDELTEKLTQEVDSLQRSLTKVALQITNKRTEVAKGVSQNIKKELEQVGIKGASFEVDIMEKGLSPDGADSVEFLFSANPDEPPKPLNRVASGGELSRIMLILKEIVTLKSGGSVIIFDEADSGIGGAVAETVGQKIKNLSDMNQVICITHLPQVAKFAGSHIRVSKSHKDNKTSVSIKSLNHGERVEELARMMGGITITQKTLDAAHEMLSH